MEVQAELMLLGAVAERLGLQPYQITYAIATRQVPEVEFKLGNRRIFQRVDVQRLAAHFKVSPEQKESNG